MQASGSISKLVKSKAEHGIRQEAVHFDDHVQIQLDVNG